MSHLVGKVVLCVDDETTGLRVRKALLESQGYCALTAESGQEALSLLLTEPIDLVILDYSMPDMEGRAVARAIKNLLPDMPIIMLSAYVDLPADIHALVDACVTKGEPTLLLLEAVAKLLDHYDRSDERRAG